MSPAPDVREVTLTPKDLHAILSGEGGADLEIARGPGGTPCMRIVGVHPGSAPARLGAENGDTIESINDLPLVDIATSYAAAASAAGQERIVIKGRRNGTPYTTILTVARPSRA